MAAARSEEQVIHSHSLDDETDAVMEPPLDEFDMWDHYQAAAVGDARKREAISQLQKSFLDQLHSEMDVNAAAAKALLHLKAKASLEASLESETSLEGAEGSPTASWWDSESSPMEQNRQHVKICDDEERTMERDMDEFDLMAQRSAAFESLPEDRKRAISALQSAFLDALDTEDVNGAAAAALKRLLSNPAGEDADRSGGKPSIFQMLFQEKLNSEEMTAETVSFDAKVEALKAWSLSLQREAQSAEDVTGAVAAAFEQIRQMIRGRRAAALKVEHGLRKISVSFVGPRAAWAKGLCCTLKGIGELGNERVARWPQAAIGNPSLITNVTRRPKDKEWWGCRSWVTLIDLRKRCSFTNLQLTAHVDFQTLPSFLRVLDRTGVLVVRQTMGLSKSAVPCSEALEQCKARGCIEGFSRCKGRRGACAVLASSLRCVGSALCDSQLFKISRRSAATPEDPPHRDVKSCGQPVDVEVEAGKAEDAWDWRSDDAGVESSIPAVRALPQRPKFVDSMRTRQMLIEDRGVLGRSVATPTSISTEASNIVKADMQSESCETDHDCLCIPSDASLLDGVRLLVLHHLAKGVEDPTAMTPGQKQLFERHVSQLAGYAEQLKQTLLISPPYLTGGTAPQEPGRDASTSSCPSEAPRALKLRDSELLEIYRVAQQEAGKEADWRGLPDRGPSDAWRYEWLRELSLASDRRGFHPSRSKTPRAPPEPLESPEAD
ncbi:unnamed protein product [Symbiodinium sp. CCMP2456]|nr:unnamed protein product [Symbiodinium sp. CCMP2456]